ncbi:translation initiation factor eIF-1A [Candidatus Micrarchaeota archaeon]|nr:translation initiation factor eIF-1A [Candidatus Micrarchaeota archaeon]
MRKFEAHKKKTYASAGGEELHIRTPREGEIMGHVEQLHGAKHMLVKCADGKMRMCRVPGKLSKIWVREDDYVLVLPWSVESDKKGDIAWRYRQVEVDWLRRNGYLAGF